MKTITTKKGTELPIMNLKGKDYLQVAHRLVWFREEHPDWSIETEYVALTDQSAFAKAVIKDQSGRVIATSHKEESLKDFPAGYREKAETGAIGRALALCGYGTQFEPELDEGSRVVDSPLGSQNGVYPEQPGENDGIHGNFGYVIDFGKWNTKTLEQVYGDPRNGPHEIANYIQWLEESSKKTGKPLGEKQLKFISQAESFLGAMENRDGAA